MPYPSTTLYPGSNTFPGAGLTTPPPPPAVPGRARWTFVVCNLDGTPIGELRNAKNRRVERPLSRVDGCSFAIRPDNPQTSALIDGDALIVAYDGVNPTPKFVGEVMSADEQVAGDQASIAVVAGGALTRLEDRLIGKSLAGIEYGSAAVQMPRTQIATEILADTMGSGDTGIRIGAVSGGTLSYAGPWWYKPASEAILEVATPLDGFDFEFAPREPAADGLGVALWTFNARTAMGQNRPDTIFEYGTGKRNVKSYSRQVDRSQLLNKGHHLPPGFPGNAADPVVAVASDAPSIAIRGVHEGVIASDVVSAPLRQRLVEEHVLVRKRPRQLITFTPKLNLDYTFGIDYGLGDVIVFRAVYRKRVRINAAFRIIGVAWDIDDNGNEQITLTVASTDS